MAWGVDTVFGFPCDGINGLTEGFRRVGDDLRFVLVHYVEAAAFMPTGYAKATGRLGVCCVTSGPGAIHLLNGLYDAKLDHAPVLAVTGLQETSVLGTSYQQEVHLARLFADVAAYNLMVTNPQQAPGVVDIAIRNALAKRTVVHLTFPNDIQVAPVAPDPYRHVAPAPISGGNPLCLADGDLRAAADLLRAGRKVAMLVGAGALHALDEVLAIAEKLAAPIVKTLHGKAVVPDDHPLTTGGQGLLGTRPSEELMEECDTLLMVGKSFPYQAPAGAQKGARSPDRRRCQPGRPSPPVEAPVVANAKLALQQLLPLLAPAPDRSFLEKYQMEMGRWRSDMRSIESPERDPIAPQYLMHVVDAAARGTWLPWPQACPTPAPCSTPSRAARSSPSSATAASPC